MNTLIMGIGNILLGDEGVGVHAVKQMNHLKSNDVTIIEAGTSFLDFLDEIRVADKIIIVDAMKADGNPGDIYKMPYSDCVHKDIIASVHGFDLRRVFSLAQKEEMPNITIVGVEPEYINWSLDLSEVVSNSLDKVQEIVKEELNI